MKQKEKDHVVNYLLTQMTYILLARSPIKDALQKAAEKHEARLRATFTEEEIAPIQVMRNTVQALAEKLVNCHSVEDLQHSHAYIEALNMGQVLIALEDGTTGEVTGYEANR
jgi:glycine cleavage system aminomethyltransferase T